MSYDNGDGRVRGARGVEIRRRFLERHPLCEHCDRRGIVTPAEEVDHRIPLHAGGADTDENKQALCKTCHRLKTNTEQGNNGHAQMFPEWLEPAACPLTIVFGPPGSGKSTLVRRRARPGDLVIDLDVIVSRLAGVALYTADAQWLNPAVRERNSLLGSLKRETRPAWLIATGTGAADRDWWCRKLKPAEVVTLAVPEDECIARIRADKRRPLDVQKAQIEAARSWWHAERGFAVRSARKVAIGLDGWPA